LISSTVIRSSAHVISLGLLLMAKKCREHGNGVPSDKVLCLGAQVNVVRKEQALLPLHDFLICFMC
jgi:hypothetical protein